MLVATFSFADNLPNIQFDPRSSPTQQRSWSGSNVPEIFFWKVYFEIKQQTTTKAWQLPRYVKGNQLWSLWDGCDPVRFEHICHWTADLSWMLTQYIFYIIILNVCFAYLKSKFIISLTDQMPRKKVPNVIQEQLDGQSSNNCLLYAAYFCMICYQLIFVSKLLKKNDISGIPSEC